MRTPITTRLAAIALLVLPLIIDRIDAERDARKDRRDDELVNQYECEPPSTCTADFDGDGSQAKIEVQNYHPLRRCPYVILVTEGGKEILRLPYDHTDGTMRTHTAVNVESGAHRLVVYDKASRQNTVGVFGWDGRRMTEVAPSPIEKEILAAMAAHDDTGGWNERDWYDRHCGSYAYSFATRSWSPFWRSRSIGFAEHPPLLRNTRVRTRDACQ